MLWRCSTFLPMPPDVLSVQVGMLPAAQDVFLDACRKPLPPDSGAFFALQCSAVQGVLPHSRSQ